MIMIILGVLTLILLVGNAYLYFFPLNHKNPYSNEKNALVKSDEWECSVQDLRERNVEFEQRVQLQSKSMARKIRSIDTSIINLNSKTKNAMGRIGRIESILAAKDVPAADQISMAKKVNRLEDFRRNATIELQAMKDAMPELKKRKLEDSSPELEEKIHGLVFHAGKER